MFENTFKKKHITKKKLSVSQLIIIKMTVRLIIIIDKFAVLPLIDTHNAHPLV